ncbi:MAG TPA: hypothetical protein VIO94_12470 [Phenylobacterium sp.]
MLQSEVRAAEYRAKAELARAAAQASTMVQVRHRHEVAESVWRELAGSEDRRTEHAHKAARQVAVTAARRAA